MKKVLKIFLLFIIYVSVFLTVYFLILYFGFGKKEAFNFNNFKIWKTVKEKSFDEIVDNNLSIEDTSISSKNEIQNRFYYNQLSDTAKTIYDVIIANRDEIKTGTATIDFNKGTFDDLLMQNNGMTTISKEYQNAVDSLRYDDVTWFYIDFTKMALKTKTFTRGNEKWFEVSLGPAEDGGTYLADGYEYKDIDTILDSIEKRTDEIIEKVDGSNYQKTKYIHDWLIDNISYDESYNMENTRNIRGALIENKVVCEGYAKTFKYLMDKINIPCIIVAGTAMNSEGESENHMWNYIELNGTWYSIDVTWDDPILIYSAELSNENKYKYFCQGDNININHFLRKNITDNGMDYEYPTLYHKEVNEE